MSYPVQGGPGSPNPQSIPNYLVQSILVTIFCCLPLGIPAIVFAAQVNGKAAAGDVNGALESSRNAKKWCWVAFGVGLAVGVIYLIAVFALGMFGAAHQPTLTPTP